MLLEFLATNFLSSNSLSGGWDGGAEWKGRERNCGVDFLLHFQFTLPNRMHCSTTKHRLHCIQLFHPSLPSISIRPPFQFRPDNSSPSDPQPKNQNKSITRAKFNAHILRIRRSFRLPPLFMTERGYVWGEKTLVPRPDNQDGEGEVGA